MTDVTSVEATVKADVAVVVSKCTAVKTWIASHGVETAGIAAVILILKGCL